MQDHCRIPRHIGSPRMLMVGEFDSAKPCPYFARALRNRGWQVHELPIVSFFATFGVDLLAKLVSRLMLRRGMAALQASIIEQIETNEVNAVFFTKGVGATPDMLQQLAERSILSICWYPDFSFEHVFVDQDCIPKFDIFITTKDFHIPFLNSVRAPQSNFLVEHGYCDDTHWRSQPQVAWEDRRYDVIFVGNHSAHKQDVITRLVAERPNLRYLVVGHRWQTVRWPTAAQAVTVRPAMAGDAMARAFNDSRIAIAIHHGKDSNPHGWEDSVSARTFEIPACGTAMLHVAGSHLPGLFAINSETACFDGMEQLVREVDRLLSEPEETMAMAQRAYARAVPAYGYIARGYEIAEVIADFTAQHAAKRNFAPSIANTATKGR